MERAAAEADRADRTERTRTAHRDRAAIERRSSGVAIRSGQRQRTPGRFDESYLGRGTILDHSGKGARAGDRQCNRPGARAVVGKGIDAGASADQSVQRSVKPVEIIGGIRAGTARAYGQRRASQRAFVEMPFWIVPPLIFVAPE